MLLWKLDEVLRRKGIKGRDLAKRMAIGENYLSRVRHEIPDRLSLSLLDALCRELECGIEDLLEYQEGPQPDVADRVRRRRPAEPTILDKQVRPMHTGPLVHPDVLPDPLPVVAEEPPASPPGAYLKTNALSSRLNQLRRKKP